MVGQRGSGMRAESARESAEYRPQPKAREAPKISTGCSIDAEIGAPDAQEIEETLPDAGGMQGSR